MKSLHHISIRSKFILALLPPILALLWFSFSGVMERRSTENEMIRMEKLITLARDAGEYAHQLQRERGLSAGYFGSQGKILAQSSPRSGKPPIGHSRCLSKPPQT